MTVFKFMGESPFLSFFMAYVIFGTIRDLFRRLTSTVKIALRGWPPAHLDADGDWKPDPEKVEE